MTPVQSTWDNASAPELQGARQVNGVTILGPDLFAKDAAGRPLSPIASLFPRYRTLVTGRGIHAMQVAAMAEYVRRVNGLHADLDAAPDEDDDSDVFQDVVCLLVRDPVVLIRSDPEDMDRVLAADALLQLLVPKERIQFTGLQLAEVRRRLRRLGESWRISPAPRSPAEIGKYIQHSRVHVSTGATYFQNASTGGRFLTFEEFQRIRPLIRNNPLEALARVREIVQLTHLVNAQGAHELGFLLPPERTLAVDPLVDVERVLDSPFAGPEYAEKLFDEFARRFADAAGPALSVDGETYVGWRNSMFCRLYDIREELMEECALSLSPEFHMNIRWLPGATVRDGQLEFAPQALPRTRNLIAHYNREFPALGAVNVGRVETAQTGRERTDEERDVYLVVLGRGESREDIRLARLMKWGVMHRVQRGVNLQQAIAETLEYRGYITDRIRAVTELGTPILSYTEISFHEEAPALGPIPVIFFERRYVPGMATDKIPPALYSGAEFVVRLARLLGVAAGTSLVLGRTYARTGRVFFDDGDEIIQLDPSGLPDKLVMAETTGSLGDWNSPLERLLPECLQRLEGHLERARAKGVSCGALLGAVAAFEEALVGEVVRMQRLLLERPERLRGLFQDRTGEPGGIRARWEGVLSRLASTDTRGLRRLVTDNFKHFQYG